MKKDIFPITDQHGGQINDEIGAQISIKMNITGL